MPATFTINTMFIGVAGFSDDKKFNKAIAEPYIREKLTKVNQQNPTKAKVLVSGLTNVGIPALAYKIAKELGWPTMGIACSKAEEYELFPVNVKRIVGTEWGDESNEFLNTIDVLYTFGGGDQTYAEAELARSMGIPVYAH